MFYSKLQWVHIGLYMFILTEKGCRFDIVMSVSSNVAHARCIGCGLVVIGFYMS